jgi:hypothetical protein
MEPELDENGFTKRQVDEILLREKEAETGINISPIFDNAEDAIAYLNSDDED